MGNLGSKLKVITTTTTAANAPIRRPQVKWEADMSQNPRHDTQQFILQEDKLNKFVSQTYTKHATELDTFLDKNITLPPPTDPAAVNSLPPTTSSSSKRGLSMDQMVQCWTVQSKHDLDQLAIELNMPVTQLILLKKYSNTYTPIDHQGKRVGAWITTYANSI